MPVAKLPILTITPALPAVPLQEIQNILCTVAHGAFGAQSDWQIVIADEMSHATLMIEHSSDAEPSFTPDVAIRLTATMLQLLELLAPELGVSVRQTNRPRCTMLSLTGLSWHRVRLSLTKLIATFRAPTLIELACPNSGLCLRIGAGKPLGRTAPTPVYLCDAIIRRRITSSGEIVRIRCGQRMMSIAIPRDVSASIISDGVLISTTPVVGLIVRRMVQVSPCQLSLFEYDSL